MPFLSDTELEGDDFVRIQSDIFDDYNEPRRASEDLAPSQPVPAGVTVVSMDDKLEMNAPVADMEGESGSSTPVQSTSKTPKSAKSTSSRTPKSALKSAEKSSGRKRKAVEIEEPSSDDADEDVEAVAPAKRGRKPAAAPSARLAAKAAKKKGPGRPGANGTTSKEKPKSKGGRPKKDTGSDVVPKGEFEVEAIVDSMIDGDTMEHLYYVKWKGYPSSENTWEPKQNLRGATELLRKFNAEKKAKKSEDASEKKAKKAKTSHKAEKADETDKTEKKAEAAPKAPKAPKTAEKKEAKPKGRPGRPPKAGKEAKPAKDTKAPAKAPKKAKEVKVPKAGTRVSSRTKSA